MRRAKIVCTMGPAVESQEKVRELIAAGMNMARLNLSHGGYDEHQNRLDRVRAAAKEAIEVGNIILKELEETIQITFNYPQLPAIMSLIKTTNAKVLVQDFQLDCNLEICIPLEQSEKLKVLLQEIENTEIYSKGIY